MRDEPSLSFLSLTAMVVCHSCYSCTMQVAVTTLLLLSCRSGQALALGASMACCAWSLLFVKSQYGHGQWLETWSARLESLWLRLGLNLTFLWPRDDDNRNPTRMMRDEPSLSFLTLMAMVVCHNCYSCTMQVAVSALLSCSVEVARLLCWVRQWHAVLGVCCLQNRNMGSGWRHGVRRLESWWLRLGLNLTFLWPP